MSQARGDHVSVVADAVAVAVAAAVVAVPYAADAFADYDSAAGLSHALDRIDGGPWAASEWLCAYYPNVNT